MPLEDTCRYNPIKAIAEVRRTASLHKRGGRLASTIRLLINRIVINVDSTVENYATLQGLFSRRLGISREIIPLFVLLMSLYATLDERSSINGRKVNQTGFV